MYLLSDIEFIIVLLLSKLTGLSKEGFAKNHPGGILGKTLRVKVKDIMIEAVHCPVMEEKSTVKDVILEMTKFPVGACAIVDTNKKLIGIMVEGDIRRTFTNDKYNLSTDISVVMTKKPIVINHDSKAIEALKLMEDRTNEIGILPVVNLDNIFLGFIRLHDLVKEGFL